VASRRRPRLKALHRRHAQVVRCKVRGGGPEKPGKCVSGVGANNVTVAGAKAKVSPKTTEKENKHGKREKKKSGSG